MAPTTGRPPDDGDDDPHVAAMLRIWGLRGREAPPPPCPICGAFAVEDAHGRLVPHHDPAAHGLAPADVPMIRTPNDAALAAVKRALGERDE